MSLRHESSVLVERPFQLDSIAPIAAPDGSTADWYRYIITQGSNRITGMRSGSRSEVDVSLHRMLDKLNERVERQHAKHTR